MTLEGAVPNGELPIALLYATLGGIFLIGLALDALGRRVHVPRVTLLMLFGLLLGPGALDLLPQPVLELGHAFSPLALTTIAFLVGGKLEWKTLRTEGREILVLSLSVVSASVLVVTGGLWIVGVSISTALLLGAISAATAPAATLDVIRQSGREGRFATNLQGIVAIDDVWGLLLFSLALTWVGTMTGNGSSALFEGLREIGGALLLGLAIGFPGAALTGRIKPGEPTLIEALGLVFLTAGLALYFDLSFLLAGTCAGAIISNFAIHHERPIHEIERIEWPFLLLFFVLAGASLHLDGFGSIWWIAAAYAVFRTLARLTGGTLGGKLAGSAPDVGWMTGLALMPQAGVAIGMALVAAERFPELGAKILAVTIATTVFFELIGPFLTQYALVHAQEETE